MTKKNTIVFAIIVIILVAIGVLLGMKLRSGGEASESKYSAVYLSTGDIYFGKLSMFPSPRLINPWVLQRGVDKDNKPQLSIIPFKKVVWGPSDEMNLNPKDIVFWTRLAADSQTAKLLDNPESLSQAPAQQPEPAAPAGEATTTKK